MSTTCFNVLKLYILTTECTYVFHIDLKINSKFFPKLQHEWGRRGTRTHYWWESQRERDRLEDKDVGGWIP
jgi:hypothetical protein